MALAEHVEQTRGEQRAEARPLRLGVEDRAAQTRLVPAVERCGTHVEVAAQDRGIAGRMARGPVRGERLVPGELAREVLVRDRLAVRTVDARDREALDARGHEARAEVGPGQPDCTVSSGLRARIATPFQPFSPCTTA
jgi:hypothetical protein